MPDDLADAARATYEELLPRHLASTRAALDALVDRDDVKFAGRVVCSALRPQFIGADRYAVMTDAAERVMRAAMRVHDALARDPALRSRLALPVDPHIVDLDAAQRPRPLYGRFDGFEDDAGELRFVEYNSLAAGLVVTEGLARAFAEMPVMQQMAQRFTLQTVAMGSVEVPDAFERFAADRGLTDMVALGVIAEREGGSDDEETGFMVRHVADRGVHVVTAPIEAVTTRHGRIFLDGVAIDVVYVRDRTVFARHGLDHVLFQAIRAGTIAALNGLFSTAVLGAKSFFELLGERDFFADDPALFDAVTRHVPWTRVLSARTTQHEGVDVDLLPYVIAHRAQLVVKPVFGFGGEGVVMGSACDEATWRAAIARGLTSPHVVQTRVASRTERYPWVRDGEVEWAALTPTRDPFVWNATRAAGCVTRLSAGGLGNTSAGASAVPTFVVTGRRG